MQREKNYSYKNELDFYKRSLDQKKIEKRQKQI